MRKYSDSIVIKFDTSSTGNAGSGKPITVYDTGTLIKAFLFMDDQITPLGNPVFADDEGNYSFTVDDGTYDLVIDEGLLTETKITKVQIADIITVTPDNTFTKYNITVADSQSVIILPDSFQSAIVIIDGVTQSETIDYTFDGVAKTVTMVAPFTFLAAQVVQVWINDMFLSGASSSIGKISNYLDGAKSNFGEAYEKCCLDNNIVDLEGLTLSTADSITIVAESKVKEIWFNGADITVLSSDVDYQGFFPKHVGPGTFRGGSMLKQVAVTSGEDTNIIQLTDVTGLVVGDFVNTSLDIYYLPNSTSRVGYVDEGDYNRITSINPATKEITLSYNFLRTALYTVSSGIIENSWVGINTTFNSGGIRSSASAHQDIILEDLTLEYWAGYVIFRRDTDISINDVGSRLTLTRCNIQNQFLDIIAWRGGDVVCDGYKCGRQYDFAKQHFVINQPKLATFSIKNGCNWSRHNFDHEFYNSGQGIDAVESMGLIVTDGTNTFDGTQPTDLPTSDYGVPPTFGQLYYGITVPIFDCLHWYAPSGGGTNADVSGWSIGADNFVGYSRSITGTLFAASASFSYDTCVFNGTRTSCQPVYINVTGKGTDELLNEYKATLINGTYYQTTDGFCRGVDVTAYNTKLIMTEEARVSPQVGTGFTTLNNIHMTHGSINGRYKIESNYPTFRDVRLTYQGTTNPNSVVLFSIDTLDASSNFILDVPEDFENTGSNIDQWDDVIPVVAWFASNASGFAPTPNFKFRLAGRSNGYTYGNNSGKQYLQSIVAAKNIAPPSPTAGKFSAKLDVGDSIIGMADDTELIVNQESQTNTTANAAGSGVSSDIIVTIAPLFTPTHVAVYSTALTSWFYYTVASVSGSTITPNENITTEFFVGDRVYLISAIDESGSGGAELLGVKVRRETDLTIPGTSVGFEVPFETSEYNELTGSWSIGVPERLIVPVGVTRVDVSATIRYISMASNTEEWLRINHYNSVSTLLDTVAANQSTSGFQAQRSSTTSLGVTVTAGDYFVVNIAHNSASLTELNKAFFTMRQVK